MGLKIHLGGKLVDEADARISVFDHGLLYGDGVFEGIRVYGGQVFLHQQHIDRLFESAKAIRLTIPLKPAEVIAAVEETVRLELDRARKMKATSEKLEEMSKHGEELKKTADHEYENRGADKAD